MDRTIEILKMIALDPGKPGTAYQEAGMTADDGPVLTDMETRKLIVYRSGGWHLTGLGDARLLYHASQRPPAEPTE